MEADFKVKVDAHFNQMIETVVVQTFASSSLVEKMTGTAALGAALDVSDPLMDSLHAKYLKP